MRLRTFGALSIASEGEVNADLALQRRQLALLAVLAAAGGAGVTRDQLLGLFWAEKDPERARHALDQSLYAIRRAIGKEAVSAGPASLVLDGAIVPSDVAEFLRAMEREDLETAVASYGGAFLEGVYVNDAPEFERWLDARRRHFADAFVQALVRLAGKASARGDFAGAVIHLRRAAAADPLSGAVAKALMLALAAAGDRSAALEAGREHTELVREELEAQADTAVRQLIERYREGSGRTPSRSSAPRVEPATPSGAATSIAPERLVAALAGRYRIDGKLGAGGMATVYLARDLKHERDVALKVLRPELAVMLGVEMFLNEIRISAGLDHPHILTLIDSGEAEGFLYYVMPLVRGESLRQRLAREHQLGIDAALSITRQVAAALDHAHRNGIVHRDIKPANILLREDDAVLTDFGIAVAVRDAGGARLTESGFSLGTPLYMSPEQAMGDRRVDARSDVYSLAAVLYEMLTGEPPHTGSTVQAVLAKLLMERPTAMRVLRATVPPGIEAAVTKGLAKSPADRFTSAGDFAKALETGAAVAAGSADGRRPWTRARRVGTGLAAAAVLALGLWGGYARSHAGSAAESASDDPTPAAGGAGGAAIGQIVVSVNGLPAALPVNVLVSGPSGPVRILGDTGEKVITHLPPGRYAVEAPAVTSGMTAYLPEAAHQEVRLTGSTMDARVAVRYFPESFAIVFMRNGDMWAMNADGSGQVNLTNHPAPGGLPSWSPDGRRIAFVDYPNGNYQIATMNFDGSARTQVTTDPSDHSGASWSPDGTRLAIVRLRADGTRAISIANADGSHAKELTPAGSHDDDPQWSPDGRSIAFMSFIAGHIETWRMKADGSERRRLTQPPGNGDMFPSWSPDGRKIVIHRNLPGNNDEIIVMDADGSHQTNLTRNPASDIDPQWSPDGTKIAWLSDRSGVLNVWVMNADGSHPVQVSHARYKARDLAWLPDGTRIAYEEVVPMPCQRQPCAGRDSTGSLFTARTDGTGTTQLTKSQLGVDWDMAWRPIPRARPGGRAPHS